MDITCPDCHFSKEVPEEDLPSRTVIATCPRCGCRFRFSPSAGVLERVDQAADDPLPEGAIVGQREEEGNEEVGETDAREKVIEKGAPFAPFHLSKGYANPWERAPGRIGWLASFYQTCIRVMFSAPRFFRSLAPECNIYLPLLFYLILSVFEFVINATWVQILSSFIADSNDPQLQALLAILAPKDSLLLMLLLQTAFATIKLYAVSALFFLVFRLMAPERATFPRIFQVIAYSIAPAILSIVPIAGSLCGALWSLACLAIGLRQSLELGWLKTCAGFLPVIVLIACFMRFFSPSL